MSTVGSYTRDEYLTWLTFITPGMLSNTNLPLFNYSIVNMPEKGAVIEIGSFAGLSLSHIIHMMRCAHRTNPVFSLDEWHFEGSDKEFIPGSTVSFAEYRNHVIEAFRRNLLLFCADRLPHHVAVSSDAFFSAWAAGLTVTDFFGREITLGGPIAMAYIDGAHTHQQSRRDFENVNRFLLPGGFIVFDDSADHSCFDSRKTAAEAAALPGYELIDKTPNYCVRKRP